MSKITFRADDDLVRELEAFDASKSEVMRDALREYLDIHHFSEPDSGTEPGVDGSESWESLEDRIDELIAERFDAAMHSEPQDVNVNITFDGESVRVSHERAEGRRTNAADRELATEEMEQACKQCGETLSSSDVFCPNCGEKASKRVFCECGDELRSDWGYCPSCGRRTPAADVLKDS